MRLDNNRPSIKQIQQDIEKMKILLRGKDDPWKEVDSLTREIDSFLRRTDVRNILDIGSRDGEVSIAFKRYFPNAKIYAFECNPQAIAICKKNFLKHPDIHLVEKAVSDICGNISFYPVDLEHSPSKNLGGSSIFPINPDYPYDKIYQTKIEVEAITLDTWMDAVGLNGVDIVWMDLQGAELKALQGLGRKIENIKLIYTGVAFVEIYKNQPLFDTVDKYLSSHNFYLYRQMHMAEHGWGNLLYVNKKFKS